MTVAYLGELTIGAVIPAPVVLLEASLVQLQGQVTAMAAFAAQLGLPPLPLVAQLQLAESIVAALNVSITLGLEPPSIDAQLGIALAALAQLELALAPFTAMFSLLATGGVFLYAYDGATNAFGAEMTTELAAGFPGHGPTDHANVLVMGTTSAATWTAMGGVFKTS